MPFKMSSWLLGVTLVEIDVLLLALKGKNWVPKHVFNLCAIQTTNNKQSNESKPNVKGYFYERNYIKLTDQKQPGKKK